MEFLHYFIEIVTAGAVLYPVVRRYVIGEEFAPHSHTEKGEARHLTTDGILYPRGTKKRTAA